MKRKKWNKVFSVLLVMVTAVSLLSGCGGERAEKEDAMQELARHAIQDGCDKCAALAQQIFDQIQEGLFADLQEKMIESKGQLNRKSEELAALQATAGDVQKQAELRMNGELVYLCSTMVIDLFEGSK